MLPRRVAKYIGGPNALPKYWGVLPKVLPKSSGAGRQTWSKSPSWIIRKSIVLTTWNTTLLLQNWLWAPTVADFFWQHPCFILATHPFYFGNTPVLFWQHTRFILATHPFYCWQHGRFILATHPFHFGNTPHPPSLGQHLSAELLALIPMVPGGYYSNAFPVALIPLLPWWLKEAR